MSPSYILNSVWLFHNGAIIRQLKYLHILPLNRLMYRTASHIRLLLINAGAFEKNP